MPHMTYKDLSYELLPSSDAKITEFDDLLAE